ncbi:unnamed protein product, partial [Mesorhabditis belari]|uniref:Phospholipid-transporting ATPase n=1 Tax=Mesorhabditis belari TaxID=2138241 RepID=A0AAF3EWS6_9BILA
MLSHHHKNSSLWVPGRPPVTQTLTQLNPLQVFQREQAPIEDFRHVQPNAIHQAERYCTPNYKKYKNNRISTTKYTLLTFPFKNLWEQFHRWANWFFVIIIVLNLFPEFAAFNRFLGIIPVACILIATAIKDIFEDLRRYRMDKKINESTCLVWDHVHLQFRRMQWQHILVGDYVHISNNELFPADILLLRSSDASGTCFIETSNLDGETSLKQKAVPKTIVSLSEDQNTKFQDLHPKMPIDHHCMHPSKSLQEMCGYVEDAQRQKENFSKDHMLWRGCRLRNTTFVEGLVLYAGPDTKVMLNNGRPKPKRSQIEHLTNKFILVCFLILIIMCMIGSAGSAITTAQNHNRNGSAIYETEPENPWWQEGIYSIGTFIINYQVLVPLSLYITVELIKLGLVFLMQQDVHLYHGEKDQRVQVRNLTIPEELGQVTHVLSDKTGTVTENIMIFRRCAFDNFDYGTPAGVHAHQRLPSTGLHPTDELRVRVLSTWRLDESLQNFFTNLAICNTVVVNREHRDMLEVGQYEDGVYTIDNSSFYTVTEPEFLERQERYRIHKERAIRFVDEEEPVPNWQAVISNSDTTLDAITSEDEEENSDEKSAGQRLSRVSTFSQRLSHSIRNFLPRISSIISSPASSVHNFRHKHHKGPKTKKESRYEAESPDELALVEGAAQYGFVLQERGATHVTLQFPDQQNQRIEVLRVLPFDANRKRMSIIIKGKSGPILYTKGADASMLTRLRDGATPPVFDESENETSSARSIGASQMSPDKARALLGHYAGKGLRTLVYGMRRLTWDEYQEFSSAYQFIEMDTTSEREMMLAQKADEIESNLTLLGVTGVEDKLQEGVSDTISSLREAGLQVWLLTGDKLETAENIARSCGLFDPRHPEVNVSTRDDLPNISGIGRCNIKLNPQALTILKENDTTLLDIVQRSASVLCYRMTPSEKSEVVACVKKNFGGRVLAIGDGANDVPMIQAAHVGVGVSGNEGMQAVMASDFAIARFRFLKRLLLIHGHWNYDRIANTYLYFLYKNALLVFIIFFCQFYSLYSGESPMDPIYSMLYSIVFTSVQPIIYGMYDQAYEGRLLIERPSLYRKTMEGQCYSWKLFFFNILDALYQAAVCYYCAHIWAVNTSVGLWEFGFVLATSMFLCNTFHLALEVRCWTWPIWVIFAFFTVLHFVFFLAYHAVIGPWSGLYGPPVLVSFRLMMQASFYIVELLTVVTALIPRLLYRVYLSKLEGKLGSELSFCGLSI